MKTLASYFATQSVICLSYKIFEYLLHVTCMQHFSFQWPNFHWYAVHKLEVNRQRPERQKNRLQYVVYGLDINKNIFGMKFDASHWIFHNEFFTIENTTHRMFNTQTFFGNWSFVVRYCLPLTISQHGVLLKVSQWISGLSFKILIACSISSFEPLFITLNSRCNYIHYYL